MNTKLAVGLGVTGLLVVSLLTYFYFFRIRVYHPDISRVVPANALFIVETSNIENLVQTVIQEPFFQAIQSAEVFNSFQTEMHFLDSLMNTSPELNSWKQGRPVAVSMHPYPQGNMHMFMAIDAGEQIQLDAVKNWIIASFPGRFLQGSHEFMQTRILDFTDTQQGTTFSITSLNQNVLFSYDGLLIEDAINRLKHPSILKNQDFEKLSFVKTLSNQDLLYVNYKQLHVLYPILFSGSTPLSIQKFAETGNFQINFQNDRIELNGASKTSDSVFQFLDLYASQMPGSLNLKSQSPAVSASLFSQRISDWSAFQSQVSEFYSNQKIEIKHTSDSISALFGGHLTDEIASVLGSEQVIACLNFDGRSPDSSTYILLKPENYEFAKNWFQTMRLKFKERNAMDSIQVLAFDSNGLFPIGNVLEFIAGPLFHGCNVQHVLFYNEYILLGPDISLLQYAVQEMGANRIVGNDPTFNSYVDKNAGNNSIEILALNAQVVPVYSQICSDAFQSTLYKNQRTIRQCNWMGIRFSPQSDKIFSTQISLQFNVNSDLKPEKMWDYPLDTTLRQIPSVLSSDIDGKSFVFAQDVLNKVYCFNSDGSLLWKLPIPGVIIGGIQERVSPLNAQRVFLFNTEHQLFMVSDSGKLQRNFPFWIPAATNMELQYGQPNADGIFDMYIASRFYKLWIYHSDLKLQANWNPHEFWPNAIQTPRMFRANYKNYYYTVNEVGKLFLLDADAKTVMSNIVDSSSFVQSAYVTSTDSLGSTWFVSADSSGMVYRTEWKNDSTCHIHSKHSLGFRPIFTQFKNNRWLIYQNHQNISVLNNLAATVYSGKWDTSYASADVFVRNNQYYLMYVDTKNKLIHALHTSGKEWDGFPIHQNDVFAIGMPQGEQAVVMAYGHTSDRLVHVYLLK